MNLSLNELTKTATQEVNFDETFFSNIEECIKYNSIGTLNWAIHTLTIIRERIDVEQKENKLFRWIADINENESLVRVLPTNVVYIRNIKLGSLTPFVTEHNNVYVYNEKTGRIEEVFE